MYFFEDQSPKLNPTVQLVDSYYIFRSTGRLPVGLEHASLLVLFFKLILKKTTNVNLSWKETVQIIYF